MRDFALKNDNKFLTSLFKRKLSSPAVLGSWSPGAAQQWPRFLEDWALNHGLPLPLPLPLLLVWPLEPLETATPARLTTFPEEKLFAEGHQATESLA